MNKNEILKKVNNVFIDVMDNKDVILEESTTNNDIDEWDSLTHILLVVGIEKEFEIRFNSDDIKNWNNVGAMLDSVEQNLKSK
jgi:acyl carrier protein